MRRKERSGIDVGGSWIIPVVDEVAISELAFIVEVSEDAVRLLLEVDAGVAAVDLRKANELLADLARAGFTDWRESSLFAQLISGRIEIAADGAVWGVAGGKPSGRSLVGRRTTEPEGAVDLDVEAFVRHRQEQGGRIRTRVVQGDGTPAPISRVERHLLGRETDDQGDS